MDIRLVRHALLCLLVAVGGVTVGLAQGKPADWKLYALVKSNDQDVAIFFSTTELRHNASGNIEVWTKGLSTNAVVNEKLSEAQIEEVAKLIAEGYKPPAARAPSLTKDSIGRVIAAELIANAGSLAPVSRVLQELDCDGRRLRMLSYWEQDSKGKTSSTDRPGEWMHAAPETYGATLLDDICPARH